MTVLAELGKAPSFVLNETRSYAVGVFWQLVTQLLAGQLETSTSACRQLPGAAGLGKSTLLVAFCLAAAELHRDLLVVFADCNDDAVTQLLPSVLLHEAMSARGIDVTGVDPADLGMVHQLMAQHGLFGLLVFDETEMLYKASNSDKMATAYFQQLARLVGGTRGRRLVGIFAGSSAALSRLLAGSYTYDKDGKYSYSKAPHLNGSKCPTVRIHPFSTREELVALFLDFARVAELRGANTCHSEEAKTAAHVLTEEQIIYLCWFTGGNARAVDTLRLQLSLKLSNIDLRTGATYSKAVAPIFDKLLRVNDIRKLFFAFILSVLFCRFFSRV
jgi:hypothetical protein